MTFLGRLPVRAASCLNPFSRWLTVLLVIFASACGSGPPPKLYLLEAQTTDFDVPVVTDAQMIESLGISPVELPGYADDARIASASPDGTLSQDDTHRWAEEPEAAITRVLSDRLRARTGATVLIEPWPRDYNPAARVEVVFDKLVREPLGGASMAGQILLLSGDGRSLLKAMPFQFIHYGRSVDKRVFFSAVAQGVDDIARMTVEALRGMKLKS